MTMYRKNDNRIFIIFSALANLAVLAGFILILIYHFYDGRPLYRDVAMIGLILSIFCKYQIILLKVYVLEIRITNLLNVGRRPGKLAIGVGNIAILVYSVIFWITVLGTILAFLPADWRPSHLI